MYVVVRLHLRLLRVVAVDSPHAGYAAAGFQGSLGNVRATVLSGHKAGMTIVVRGNFQWRWAGDGEADA